MLAFVAVAKGKSGLWVRPLDRAAPLSLPGTDGASHPFWSPDGRSIGYFAGNKLWRASIASGSPLPICEVGVGRGAAWSEDGTIIFATYGRGLRRVPASGGSPVSLTDLDFSHGEVSHSWPQLLSRGRLLYWARGNSEAHTGAYAVALDQPARAVRLINITSNALFAAGHLLWLHGSTLVAQKFDPGELRLSGEPFPVADPVGSEAAQGHVAASASTDGALIHSASGGGSQLEWRDRSGKTLGALGEIGNRQGFRISPDGRRISVASSDSNRIDLWMVEIGRDAWRRFTFLPGLSTFPVWSPDGRTIVFRSSSPRNLYRKEASGAGTEQAITSSDDAPTPTDWSREGRLLLYHAIGKKTGLDLWVLPVTPDGKPEPGVAARPYLRTPANEISGRFLPQPNPRWVVYVSDDSGVDEVYVQAFPEPRGKEQISTGGGRHPRWSPDGREIFYLGFDNKLMAVSVRVSAESAEHSTPRELFTVPWDVTSIESPYDVAPDGLRFLVQAAAEPSPQPLHVILNWPALLKNGSMVE